MYKPRNFSAIVRTCDAVGINELHAVPGEEGLAIHWKTSQGAEKWMRVHAHHEPASSLPASEGEGLPAGGSAFVAMPTDYRELDYTVPTALVVGTELFGVSEAGACSCRPAGQDSDEGHDAVTQRIGCLRHRVV